MILTLKDFDHFLDDKRVQFKVEKVNGEEITIISYMIATKEYWKIPLALETRGITFNSKGEIIARPFEKFFNYMEIKENFPKNIKGKIQGVYEKRDGSMISPVLINGQIYLKTKKSFYSEIAIDATNHFPANIAYFSVLLIKDRISPIFEYTSPNNKIVLNYGEIPKFVLLAARDMDTGEYIESTSLFKMAKEYGVDIIPEYKLSFNEILDNIQNQEKFEGYVALLNDKRRVKFKTNWYLTNHRIATELRIRDVAELVIDEKLDDIKSTLVQEGYDLKKIEDIEEEVISQISEIIKECEYWYNKYKHLDIKNFVEKIKSDKYSYEYFPLIISLKREKEPNYREYWKQRFLKSFSLAAIYNERF
jgi:T4 RnlA family RNA ligase